MTPASSPVGDAPQLHPVAASQSPTQSNNARVVSMVPPPPDAQKAEKVAHEIVTDGANVPPNHRPAVDAAGEGA
jgi:hypothetical protein